MQDKLFFKWRSNVVRLEVGHFIPAKAKKYPRIVRRGWLKCFHNGIILIVICFKLYGQSSYYYRNTK